MDLSQQEKYAFSNSWFAWVPTNLGKIRFSLLARHNLQQKFGKFSSSENFQNQVTYKNLDISFLSDSLKSSYLNLFFKREKEYFLQANATIKQITSSQYEGNILLFNEYLEIKATFSTDDKAIITINPLSIEYKQSTDRRLFVDPTYRDTVEKTLASAMYNVLKLLFHLDNHHHQKIDTILKVYKGSMDYDDVINTFARHVKDVEVFVKRSRGDNYYLKNLKSLHEIDGYMAYVETFNELFGSNNNQKCTKCQQTLKLMKNVRNSLEANIKKYETIFEFSNKTKTILLTSLGLGITFLFSFYRFVLGGTGLGVLTDEIRNLWMIGATIFITLITSIIMWKYIINILFSFYELFETIKYIIWGRTLNSSLNIVLLLQVLIPIGFSIYFAYRLMQTIQ